MHLGMKLNKQGQYLILRWMHYDKVTLLKDKKNAYSLPHGYALFDIIQYVYEIGSNGPKAGTFDKNLDHS